MIHIAICDDNEDDLLQLEGLIQEIMEMYSVHFSVKRYHSGEELLETDLNFHLIFLDVVMNGKDGIQIGKQIYRRNHTIKIIFQTNFSHYCKDAINQSHAFAFLEKPVQRPAMEEQIREFIKSNENIQEILVEFKNVRYTSDGKEIEKAVLGIPIRMITYFEYMKLQKSIKINTEKGEFIYPEVMNKLEKRMKPLGFETSCRGILVNLEKVMKIKGYKVLLNTGDTVPLSQRRVAEFKERINEYVHDSFH